MSFLPKNKCDVASVEFASALRLTNNTIEPLSFTVPRIKVSSINHVDDDFFLVKHDVTFQFYLQSELFQDDLFPPTKVTWKPSMTSRDWFGGSNKQAPRISLKPPGMDNC